MSLSRRKRKGKRKYAAALSKAKVNTDFRTPLIQVLPVLAKQIPHLQPDEQPLRR